MNARRLLDLLDMPVEHLALVAAAVLVLISAVVELARWVAAI
jgi:hypothetical protein